MTEQNDQPSPFLRIEILDRAILQTEAYLAALETAAPSPAVVAERRLYLERLQLFRNWRSQLEL